MAGEEGGGGAAHRAPRGSTPNSRLYSAISLLRAVPAIVRATAGPCGLVSTERVSSRRGSSCFRVTAGVEKPFRGAGRACAEPCGGAAPTFRVAWPLGRFSGLTSLPAGLWSSRRFRAAGARPGCVGAVCSVTTDPSERPREARSGQGRGRRAGQLSIRWRSL